MFSLSGLTIAIWASDINPVAVTEDSSSFSFSVKVTGGFCYNLWILVDTEGDFVLYFDPRIFLS